MNSDELRRIGEAIDKLRPEEKTVGIEYFDSLAKMREAQRDCERYERDLERAREVRMKAETRFQTATKSWSQMLIDNHSLEIMGFQSYSFVIKNKDRIFIIYVTEVSS